MRQLLIVLLIAALKIPVLAGQPLVYDSSAVHAREFAAGKMQEFRSNPAFDYEKTAAPAVSYWDRFWAWFWRKIADFFDSKAGNFTFRWIIIPIAVAIIVFFIVRVTGMTDGNLFDRKNRNQGLSFSATDEDIHAINFDEDISRAIGERNFRLAIRLLYLQSLKTLADNGKINWQPGKTNFAYWQELAGQPYQEGFLEITRRFEQNWYGNMTATGPEFFGLQQVFIDFNRQSMDQ